MGDFWVVVLDLMVGLGDFESLAQSLTAFLVVVKRLSSIECKRIIVPKVMTRTAAVMDSDSGGLPPPRSTRLDRTTLPHQALELLLMLGGTSLFPSHAFRDQSRVDNSGDGLVG